MAVRSSTVVGCEHDVNVINLTSDSPEHSGRSDL